MLLRSLHRSWRARPIPRAQVHHAAIIWGEAAGRRVPGLPVVRQQHVALLPIVRIDPRRLDAWRDSSGIESLESRFAHIFTQKWLEHAFALAHRVA